MTEKYIIDRFEGDYAVCETEDMSFINIDIPLLPHGVKEGDVITADSTGRYVVNPDVTEVRQTRIKEKMNKLWK